MSAQDAAASFLRVRNRAPAAAVVRGFMKIFRGLYYSTFVSSPPATISDGLWGRHFCLQPAFSRHRGVRSQPAFGWGFAALCGRFPTCGRFPIGPNRRAGSTPHRIGPVAFVLALFIMASAVSALAQPAEEPTVDSILDRYIRALGGKAAILKLTSRVSKGTITFPAQGVTGNIEVRAAFPDKLLVITDLPGIGRLRQGYDGTVGWVEDPQTGIRQVSGVELDDLRRSAAFDRALHMKDVFPDLTFKDRETVDGRDVWVLETKLDPLTYRLCFSVDTGLIVHVEMDQAQDGGGKTTITLDPGDYRPVAGVMVPWSIKEAGPAMGWEEKFTEITPNVPIDESFFARPRAGSTP